jgi:hypothetical protein
MNTDLKTLEGSAVLAMALNDMQFLGLIKLKPDEDGKLSFAIVEGKPRQAEDQNNMSKKAA